jgi:hypothetical protein
MSQSLPTDPDELESLAERVRAFLRLSRAIPIVIIEKREPEGREDWKTSRHRAALAQIESCCLVPSEACTRAEGLASFGVSYLNYVELDCDLVVPTNAGDLIPTFFGGPREYRPLPPGGIRVSSADSSWPWGHLITVAKVNLEACRQDAEDLARRLERREGPQEKKQGDPLEPGRVNLEAARAGTEELLGSIQTARADLPPESERARSRQDPTGTPPSHPGSARWTRTDIRILAHFRDKGPGHYSGAAEALQIGVETVKARAAKLVRAGLLSRGTPNKRAPTFITEAGTKLLVQRANSYKLV